MIQSSPYAGRAGRGRGAGRARLGRRRQLLRVALRALERVDERGADLFERGERFRGKSKKRSEKSMVAAGNEPGITTNDYCST